MMSEAHPVGALSRRPSADAAASLDAFRRYLLADALVTLGRAPAGLTVTAVRAQLEALADGRPWTATMGPALHPAVVLVGVADLAVWTAVVHAEAPLTARLNADPRAEAATRTLWRLAAPAVDGDWFPAAFSDALVRQWVQAGVPLSRVLSLRSAAEAEVASQAMVRFGASLRADVGDIRDRDETDRIRRDGAVMTFMLPVPSFVRDVAVAVLADGAAHEAPTGLAQTARCV